MLSCLSYSEQLKPRSCVSIVFRMRGASVFYVLLAIFVVVYSAPELCVIKAYFSLKAYCGKGDVEHIFDFVPTISQNVTYLTMQGQPLRQLPYNAFRNVSSQRNISYLRLESCQISRIDAGALVHLHNLSSIDLSDNQISQIDSTLFRHTKQIRIVDFYLNKIEVVPSGLFRNLTLLEEVHLHANQIRQVEMGSFENTPALWKIALHINQIESMRMSFKDNFDNLTILWLDRNPWKCNCDLGPLYEYLKKKGHVQKDYLACETPLILRGKIWKDIGRDVFVCASEEAVPTQTSVTTSTPIYNGTMYLCLSGLVLVCLVPVILGVVFLKRRSNRRANSCNMDSVQGVSSGSEDSDSELNMADVDEKSTFKADLF